MARESLRVVDLFAGCGGMSLGFENAGFKVVAAFDNWKPAIEVYRRNFTHPIFDMDLEVVGAVEQIAKCKPDVIVGGPPCQDFSIAGRREFDGKRANLTMRFAEIVMSVRPQYFVMENVYNIQKTPVLEKVLTDLQRAGYGLTHGVFDASLMNVPQKRKRYIVIGEFQAEDESFRDGINRNLAEVSLTVREHFGEGLDTNFYYMHPRSYARRGIFSVDQPSSTIRGVNRPIPPTYKIHSADATRNLQQVRMLTTKERSYIQTFPKTFEFVGPSSAIEQMIGNAVPVNMARFIADRILEASSAKSD